LEHMQATDFGGHLAAKSPIGGTISRYGTTCFTSNYGTGTVSQIKLNTAWDLSSYSNIQEFSTIDTLVMGTGWQLSGIFWSENGEYCLITSRANNNTLSSNNALHLFQVQQGHAYDLNYATLIDTNDYIDTAASSSQSANGCSMSRNGSYYSWSYQGSNRTYSHLINNSANYYTLSIYGSIYESNAAGGSVLGMVWDHSGKHNYFCNFNGDHSVYYRTASTQWRANALSSATTITLPQLDTLTDTNITRDNMTAGGVLPNEGYAVLVDYGSNTGYNFQLFEIS